MRSRRSDLGIIVPVVAAVAAPEIAVGKGGGCRKREREEREGGGGRRAVAAWRRRKRRNGRILTIAVRLSENQAVV